LVVTSADHGHTSQIVENVTEDDLRSAAEDAKLPIERMRDLMYPGLTRKLTTADDAEMTISYGTSADVAVEDQTHTGTQVRIAAFGPRAATWSPDRSERPVLRDKTRWGSTGLDDGRSAG
jgi:alkaline phosphatase